MVEREKSVMIIDSGSRGQAMGKHFREHSPEVGQIYMAPGNGGTDSIDGAQNVEVNMMNNREVVEAARAYKVDLVIICPEKPLANGVVDALKTKGIAAFGPTQETAKFEWSKACTMQFLKDRGIPHPNYEILEGEISSRRFFKNPPAWAQSGMAIKADDLRDGKGVVVIDNLSDAEYTVSQMMEGGMFGEKVQKIVLQEKLVGIEISPQAIVKGKNYLMLPYGEDHKQVFDGDRGSMTGGMGVRVPHPMVTSELASKIEKQIIKPIVHAMNKEGINEGFLLYPAIMVDAKGQPKVIEINMRPGGPEWETVLKLTESNLYQVLNASARGNLEGNELQFSEEHALSVVIASKGYPGEYETGKKILGLENLNNVYVDHAGTKRLSDGSYITSGGRVLLVSATGETFSEAHKKVYEAIENISFEGEEMEYRTDIGRRRHE